TIPAAAIARLVRLEPGRKHRVLDIAAGHGKFGIAFAREYPKVEIVAQDWPNVLEVARENARAAGVEDRFRTLPGSAFDVDYGSGYDLVLLTNFLHHFDPETCERLLRKARAALAPGARAATLEFVPNEDRVSPPVPATFSLMMLGSTPKGDAYTFSELERMFRNAGFARSELHALPPTFQSVVISYP
ncbi:MAG: methyltransferase type 12, partial [Acidobacteria bacterium]